MIKIKIYRDVIELDKDLFKTTQDTSNEGFLITLESFPNLKRIKN